MAGVSLSAVINLKIVGIKLIIEIGRWFLILHSLPASKSTTYNRFGMHGSNFPQRLIKNLTHCNTMYTRLVTLFIYSKSNCMQINSMKLTERCPITPIGDVIRWNFTRRRKRAAILMENCFDDRQWFSCEMIAHISKVG